MVTVQGIPAQEILHLRSCLSAPPTCCEPRVIPMRTAYLLVSHGSSDPRHQAGLTRLAHGVRQHLGRLGRSEQPAAGFGESHREEAIAPSRSATSGTTAEDSPLPWRSRGASSGAHSVLPLVGTATLEAAEQSLAEQIVQFAQATSGQAVQQIVLVPLFLLAGVHVKEDLPVEIAAARSQLPAHLQVNCLAYLGSQGQFRQYVAARLAKTNADRCVLLAHGSRRTAGNRVIQQLGKALDTEVAFWSVPPNLETQVSHLMQQGHQHIAIAPFFLFPGGITDAITRQTEQIAEHLPTLSLRLLSPLGTSSDLSKVVAELALAAPHPLPAAPTGHPGSSSAAQNGITA